MKQILGLILISTLFGCQKYEQISNPQLNLNGQWRIVNINPTFQTTVTNSLQVTNSDFYALSPFIIVSTNTTNNTMVIKNDTTNIRPCFFYKNGYVWEFDYNTLILRTNMGKTLKSYNIWYRDSYYNPNDFFMTDNVTGETIPGNWHVSRNGNGSMPANELYIDVPEIWFDIMSSNRTYVRAINQKITLRLTR